MELTADDWVEILGNGPWVGYPRDFWLTERAEAVGIEVVDSDVAVSVRWERCPHIVQVRFNADEVNSVIGDDLFSESDRHEWPHIAGSWIVYRAGLGPVQASRELAKGAIRVQEIDGLDARYGNKYLLASQYPGAWREVANYAAPIIPPKLVESWRGKEELVSWHFVSVRAEVALPPIGHVATRWVSDGVAALSYLEMDEAAPKTFRVMAMADAAHRASGEGAHSMILEVDVDQQDVDLLGFETSSRGPVLDTRLLNIDVMGIRDFVASTRGWRPTGELRRAIEAKKRTSRYAG
jgi:hypothetical protein